MKEGRFSFSEMLVLSVFNIFAERNNFELIRMKPPYEGATGAYCSIRANARQLIDTKEDFVVELDILLRIVKKVEVLSNGNVKYSPPVSNYNWLVEEHDGKPALFVLNLSRPEPQNIILSEDNIDNLKRSFGQRMLDGPYYWKCFTGLPPTENKSNIAVQIPATNLLGINSLFEIMQRLALKESI